jgi:hypothetical protein
MREESSFAWKPRCLSIAHFQVDCIAGVEPTDLRQMPHREAEKRKEKLGKKKSKGSGVR